MPKEMTMVESLNLALDEILRDDESAFLIGEGVPDPKAIFGTTKGLKEKYPKRVFDSPISENGVTGVCIGAAITGMRPIIVHQRVDFMMYAMDQIVNNAAKWYSMFGGKNGNVPFTMRAIIGRGWGQGNQHSQNLAYMFAGMPGLKVVMPSTAENARALLHAAHKDENPVIFLEHRWVHNTTSIVNDDCSQYEIGKARIALEGSDVTIVAWGYMVHEALKAADFLKDQGIKAEVVDMLSLSPLDMDTVFDSIDKTQNLVVVDEAWKASSIGTKIIADVTTGYWLKNPPELVANPDSYAPSSHGLVGGYYVTFTDIIRGVEGSTGREIDYTNIHIHEKNRLPDVPDQSFKGPL